MLELFDSASPSIKSGQGDQHLVLGQHVQATQRKFSLLVDRITYKTRDLLVGKSMEPFLKWPGGKRWLVESHSHVLPEHFGRYIEPFLGSGAVFFSLQPAASTLSDLNAELVLVYKQVKAKSSRLTKLLQRHQKNHSHKYYYEIRASIPADPTERAARLIYLNRTCFNGIYRVNLKGQFNVPKGTKNSVVLPSDDFDEVARSLRKSRILVADFESTIRDAESGDLVFADPPYTVLHNVNGFVKYNERLFSWDDQIRLANSLTKARDRGVQIVSTNANHRSIRKLYRDRGFLLKKLNRFSVISASAKSRKQFEELLVTSM